MTEDMDSPRTTSTTLHSDEENPPVSLATEKRDPDDGRKLVHWEEGDAENPHNWSTAYKSWITLQLGLLALAASAGSSIISPVSYECHVMPSVFIHVHCSFSQYLFIR